MTGKKLTSIFLIPALLLDVTGHSVAFGVGLRAHDTGTTKRVAVAPYIEDVFSSYLYTGNASAQTITNGIDLAGKGGLIIIKNRTTGAGVGGGAYGDNTNTFTWQDTVRGVTKTLASNRTNAQTGLGGFPSDGSISNNGFTLGYNGFNDYNYAAQDYASWTFRKAPKFFDVVTYTGDGLNNRQIGHSLGIAPGMIIVKNYGATADWNVWHRSGGFSGLGGGYLNLTNAFNDQSDVWQAAPTSTQFSLRNGAANVSGQTYVAYLFAHDPGQNGVIQCGSFTTDGSGNAAVNLGWEPQYILYKTVPVAANWRVLDISRGMVANGNNNQLLYPNVSDAEANTTASLYPTATGFGANAIGVTTYIYLAIRRGPMRTPTSGTQVFLTNDGGGSITGDSAAVGFPVDAAITAYKTLGGRAVNDRLRGFGTTNTAGSSPLMDTSGTAAESAWSGSNPYFYNAWNTTILRGSNGADPGGGIVTWFFRRAPGVFDVVAYAGTGAARTVAHNLGSMPELIIVKVRSSPGYGWAAYYGVADKYMEINSASGGNTTTTLWNNTSPTVSAFSVGAADQTNLSSANLIAYLFASKAGVSKVGSYTGNGASQTISANFSAGARFILIKRTDAAGDWFVWDSVRGIVAGNDPHFRLNFSEGQVTTVDSVDPDSGGFVVNQDAATNINVNGGTYIYLAFQ